MSIFYIFVAIMVTVLLYFNMKYFFKTRDYFALAPIGLQFIVITMTILSAISWSGTNNFYEFVYLLFGIIIPLGFLLMDKPNLKKKIVFPKSLMAGIDLEQEKSILVDILDILPEQKPEVVLFNTNTKDFFNKIEQKLITAHKGFEKADYKSALKTYEFLTEIIDNEYLEYNLGNLLYRVGSYETAIVHYKKSLELSNTAAEQSNKKNKKEQKNIAKKLEIKEILFNMANSYFMSENYMLAASNYKKIIEIDVDFKTAVDNYIKSLVKIKNFDEAILFCNTLLEKSPDSKYHLIIARIYFEMNNTTKCESELLKALELDEKYKEGLALLAEIYTINQRENEALQIYNRLIKLYPDDYSNHYALGKLLLSTNDYNGAISSLEFATNLNPDMFEAYYNMAICHEKNGEIVQAVTTLKKIVTIKADFIPAYTRLWETLSKESRYLEFIDICRSGVEKNPSEYILHFYMGVAFSNMGRYEEALSAFSNVLEINSEMKGANLYIGIALTKIRKYEEAIIMFRNALLESPNDNEVFYNMSITYCLQERFDKAITTLKKAVELNPQIKDKICADKDFECLRGTEEFKIMAS